MDYETLLALHQGGARLQIVAAPCQAGGKPATLAIESNDGQELVSFQAPVRVIVVKDDPNLVVVYLDSRPRKYVFECLSTAHYGWTTCGADWAEGQPLADLQDERVKALVNHLAGTTPGLEVLEQWPRYEAAATHRRLNLPETFSWRFKEKLDDMVHNHFAELAAEWNRKGCHDQIRFLLAHHYESQIRGAAEDEDRYKTPGDEPYEPYAKEQQ